MAERYCIAFEKRSHDESRVGVRIPLFPLRSSGVMVAHHPAKVSIFRDVQVQILSTPPWQKIEYVLYSLYEIKETP